MILPGYPECYLLLVVGTNTPWGSARLHEGADEYRMVSADMKVLEVGRYFDFDVALKQYNLKAVRRPCVFGG